MNMRGWRRLGVVLSVLWFFGFGWWLRQADYDRAWNYAGHATCIELGDCERASERFLAMATPWWGIIVMDVLSIALMWLLAWIIIRVGRWVALGFRT
jgi:hypothetical protein